MTRPPMPRVVSQPTEDTTNAALHKCIVTLCEAVDREREALAPIQRQARTQSGLYYEVARRVARINDLEYIVRVMRDKLVVPTV